MKQTQQSFRQIAGANLERLVKESNLTQDKAAEKLSFSDGRCIRRLYRKGIADVDEISRIANAFGVSLGDMLRPLE